MEGSKKRQKKPVFWKIGKSFIVNQPVQLESWQKRWICGFSPRLRQNIKNSRKSLQKKIFFLKKFRKIIFLSLFGRIFFPFSRYLYFRRVTQCFRTKKISKKWNFFENLVFYGAFFGPKGAFSHGIPKKYTNFIIQSCSQHISPHLLFLHMLCKKIAQLPTAVFATFFRTLFFLVL